MKIQNPNPMPISKEEAKRRMYGLNNPLDALDKEFKMPSPKPSQSAEKQKFELTKDFPPFKKGDIVVGRVVTMKKNPLTKVYSPDTYLYVNKDDKEIKIPLSGGGADFLKPVVEKKAETPEPTKAEVKTEPQSEPSLFSTKNIFIGIVLVVGIIGVLKYKKVI